MRISNIIRAILDPFKRKDDSLFGDAAKSINKDLKELNNGRIKVSDLERLFRKFKKTEMYSEMMLFIISKNEDEIPKLDEIRKKRDKYFQKFRLYLLFVVPQINETEMDYCILTLLGIKQKDINKFIYHLSQSGVRNIKLRLKKKMPDYLNAAFFHKKH